MTNQNSLVSRLFKAKYFPSSSFLNSKIGHNPSFVWRSICQAKFILRAGNRWCIGDRINIPVWNENWLRDGSCLVPPTTYPPFIDHLCVADIINPEDKSWNIPLITSIFDPVSVNKILNTPLFSSCVEDRQIWRVERRGEYSVKSAYRFCVHNLIDVSFLSRPGPWYLIWKIRTLPKVKNFMWRVCRNCLPTCIRIQDKGINCPDQCVLCDARIEDSLHVFFLCSNSQGIWARSRFFTAVNDVVAQETDITNVIFNLLQQLNDEDAAQVATILWSIWKQRNNMVWNNTVEDKRHVIPRAEEMIRSWADVRSMQHHVAGVQPGVDINRWKKPLPGRFKCNIDASFTGDKVGIGVCLRDDSGAFVSAKTEWFSPKCDVHVGEALGLLSALKWVHELNLGPVDFESDSKIVVDSFLSPSSDVTEFGILLERVENFSLLLIQTPVLSLFGDKQMRLFIVLRRRPHL
jgi:hypothetical protein